MTGAAAIDLDVVIVNYSTYSDTMHCVQRLLSCNEVAPQSIYVVDNCSPDGSGVRLKADLPEGVNVILSSNNAGFAAGVNLGVRAGSAGHILVLNPDCYPTEAGLGQAVDYLRDCPEVGIVGLRLIYPDGSPQHSARTFYTLLDIIVRRTPLKTVWPFSRLNRSHLMMDAPSDRPYPADWVLGTGFMVRRAVFETLGGMDERYFLYMEDVDLCARTQIAGFQVHMLPTVKLVHDHRRGSGSGLFSRMQKIHLASLRRFFRKFGFPLLGRPRLARMAALHAASERESQRAETPAVGKGNTSPGTSGL